MFDQKDIKAALDKARTIDLGDRGLNFKDQFIVKPQLPEGTSGWATLVKDGKLMPHAVLWALKEGNPPEWLAARVEIPFEGFSFSKKANQNIFYFNLKNIKDRQIFTILEQELTTYLAG